MNINYWQCKFAEYEEDVDDDGLVRIYNCNHEKGCGTCKIDNKWNDKEAFCELAEKEIDNPEPINQK